MKLLSIPKQIRWKLVSLLLVLTLVMASGVPAVSANSSPSRSLIVCTENASATFTLTTKSGYVVMPDGNTVYMWSYANGNHDFQFPGPILCVNEGDTVTVVLHNTLPVDVSINFLGQEGVLANGAPNGPQFSGSEITSLARPAAANGGTVTYQFVASRPGTFIYESGTNTTMQVQMGLFGAVVVRPTGHSDWTYNRTDSQFNTSAEYIMMLSEIDPLLHTAVENNQPYDMANYLPRYWLINGRGYPDTVAPNFAPWLPTQPYGSLVHVQEYDAVLNPLPSLVRYLSVGTEVYPFHPHGNNSLVVGRDGYPLEGSGGEDLSYEKFSLPVGPGQTWDALFTWQNVDQYDDANNPIPVQFPDNRNLTIGQFYSGNPYLGMQDVLPAGTITYNQCGEYYHIAHNHALYQITSWGLTMSGMITFTRIDPLGGCP